MRLLISINTNWNRASAALARSRPAIRLRARGESGQALVEFTLVLLPVLLVVVGIASFGRLMNYNEQATHLVNEAARYASVNQVPAGATGTLGAWLRAQADSDELQTGTGDVKGAPQVCVSYPNGTSNPGDPVTISMSFSWQWLPVIGFPTTTVTRTATMRIESQPSNTFYAAACS